MNISKITQTEASPMDLSFPPFYARFSMARCNLQDALCMATRSEVLSFLHHVSGCLHGPLPATDGMPVRVSEAKPMQHICTHHLAAATAEAMRTHFQTCTRVIANTRSLQQLLRHHHLLCANVSTVSSQCQILATRSLLCSQPIYASGRWRAYSRMF
jgi:hypothetical protein